MALTARDAISAQLPAKRTQSGRYEGELVVNLSPVSSAALLCFDTVPLAPWAFNQYSKHGAINPHFNGTNLGQPFFFLRPGVST